MRQATRCSPSKRWRRSACCCLRWVLCLPSPLLFAVLTCYLDGVEITSMCVSQVEESVLSIGKFNSMVSLAAFFPFKSAQAALENMNAISEGKWASYVFGHVLVSSVVMMFPKSVNPLSYCADSLISILNIWGKPFEMQQRVEYADTNWENYPNVVKCRMTLCKVK